MGSVLGTTENKLTTMKQLKATDRILVANGVIKKLSIDCGVNVKTVSDALRGTRDTETQRLIRQRAIQFYGGKF